MTENISKDGAGKGPERVAQAHGTITIPVKTGHAEERVVELELGGRVIDILDIVAAERGCCVEELILFREGEDEPLAAVIIIEVDYPHKRRHHVHHAGAVDVTVYYQAGQLTHSFKRNATVKNVLAWAIQAYQIDSSLATELELARHGQREELIENEHIGHLAGAHHELALDLVRGDIANGSCS